jgi:hypothetical protein
VPGQPFVDERVVRSQQVEDAVVFGHDAAEKHFRLTPERLPQVVVEVREHPGVRARGRQVSQIQPLARKVRDQRIRTTVGQHPLHLLFQHRRLVQRPADGQAEQFLVWNAAPEKERQA